MGVGRERSLTAYRMHPLGGLCVGALGALVLSLVVGCAAEKQPQDSAPDPLLLHLESLAFVPADRVVAPGSWEVFSNAEALLVGRFEVTRGEWQAHLGDDPERLALCNFGVPWEPGTEHWPASGMTLTEARDFALAEGMRLLTFGEWMRLACGPRAQAWPWGPTAARSRANSLDLGLLRPAPVGAFQLGCTSSGIHDLIGNVQEWVDIDVSAPEVADGVDREDELIDTPGAERSQGTSTPVEGPLPAKPGGGAESLESSQAPGPVRFPREETWAMGGSYLTWERPLLPAWAGAARPLHGNSRSQDVGIRVCAEALAYLEAELPQLSPDGTSLIRLGRLGQRWGSTATPVLKRLSERMPQSMAARALFDGSRR